MKLSDLIYDGRVLCVEDLATDKEGPQVMHSGVTRATLHLGEGVVVKVANGVVSGVSSPFGSADSSVSCRSLAACLREAASTMEDAGRLWERFEPVAKDVTPDGEGF